MTTPSLSLDLPDEAATHRLGAKLGALVRPGDVVALHGTLGTGKTALARALIQSLMGSDEDVPSPTFTLVQTYDSPAGMIWHFDLYRLERPDDCWELGLEDALADGIAVIEWPERMGPLLPRQRLDVTLATHPTTTGRLASLSSHRQWDDRIGDLA
jgi:tRNA threonylcarbamoyladenosine biosynthesis protein TsaE